MRVDSHIMFTGIWLQSLNKQTLILFNSIEFNQFSIKFEYNIQMGDT